MLTPCSLLVSSTPTVIESIEKICSSAGNFPLGISSDLSTTVERLNCQNVVLLLAHLPAVGETADVQHLLQTVTRTRRPCATVVLADARCEEQAAAVLRAGAADYVHLPVEQRRLCYLINAFTGQLESRSSVATRVLASRSTNAEADGLALLMQQVERVAPQDSTILLLGETGTGKTRLARLIHELSPRSDEPFLVVDCGSLSPSLIESELFGHVRGAFTGACRERTGKLAAAAKGTLFLDEINSLSLPLQTKLLRAVDARVFGPVGSNREQPLRARLITATNVSLEDEMAAGRFRPDLYYRLNVVGFFLPPLRERRAAIPALAKSFQKEFAARNRPEVHGFSPAALRALQAYDWPGNIRELRNVVERAFALCEGPEVTPPDLPDAVRGAQSVCSPDRAASEDFPEEPARFSRQESKPGEDSPDDSTPDTLHATRREFEIRRIREALDKHDNNRTRAAMDLGISRVGLYKKLQQYGFMSPRDTKGE
jgi:DNA-binding NtrC family response regulator